MRFILFGLALASCDPPPLSEICSSAQTCAAGGTYVLCTTNAGTGAFYNASDGTTFGCVSATDCTDAFNSIVSWCATH